MKTYLLILLPVIYCTLVNAQIIKKEIPDKLVVLTFDDGPASHYSVVAPLLKKYDFGATFFVCEFPPNYQDSSKYMNWRQIAALDNMGFEVANHTHTHAAVSKLTEDEFITELDYIENKCESLGMPIPKNFAYPGYSLSPASLKTLEKQHYVFARAGGSRAYDPEVDHPFLVPSWAMDSENESEIYEAFSKAKQGKIVVLTIHGVPDIEHPWVNTPPELFEEYLDYLSKNDFTVISMKDLTAYIDVKKAKELIQPDFSKKSNN